MTTSTDREHPNINFSQYYRNGDRGVTIRNDVYKLNCIVSGPLGAAGFSWAYYKYRAGEIPGLENAVATADDIFSTARADVIAGVSNPAADNLNELLDELIGTGNYELTDDGLFPWVDPR